MTSLTPFPATPGPDTVMFQRPELNEILSLYGRMVAAGEWRDYGISALKDAAVFSIFRRAAEQPIYRIEKRPRLRNRQGQYAVIGMDGRILKRGHDLRQVLRVFDAKALRFGCTCSRARIAGGLLSLGEDELRHVVAEQGDIETQCHFCHTRYVFTAADVESLLENPDADTATVH